jgi:poly(glycerol-phosphate) alpha-glucosyltransferase
MSAPRIGLLSAWLSRRNGGVFEAVVAQVALLRDQGFSPVVIGLDDRHHAADRARFGGVEVIACATRGPGRLGYAPALAQALREAKLDLLHLHGLWTWPSRAAAGWAGANGRPLIVSPHGMLDPWILARGRLQKAVARPWLERPSWSAATMFHALTDAEAGDITRTTGRRRIAVVPNPVPFTGIPSPPRERAPLLLYFGRLHPKKNLAALIEAWATAVPALPAGARLEIVGWGRAADVAAVRHAIARHPSAPIRLGDPLFGADKQAALASARFLVLPSLGEGLPMAVLEGWAAGTPALLSAGCHLPEGEAAGAALPCGTVPHDISAAIARAFACPPSEWHAMSAAAQQLAYTRFSPDVVGAHWARIYDELLGRQGRRAA